MIILWIILGIIYLIIGIKVARIGEALASQNPNMIEFLLIVVFWIVILGYLFICFISRIK